MRGYLPDSSPALHTTWEGAVADTITELDQYGEYFIQGMSQVWIDLMNFFVKCSDDDDVREDDCDINLLWEFIEKVKDGHWNDGVPLDEIEWENMKGALECEREIRELRRLDPEKVTPGTPWSGWAGNQHYFIEESDRSANDIPMTLEGEELEEKVSELNEGGW
jgi:hypothetical protein